MKRNTEYQALERGSYQRKTFRHIAPHARLSYNGRASSSAKRTQYGPG